MPHLPTRRAVLALGTAGAATFPGRAQAARTEGDRFVAGEFATVGVFGVDWLRDPVFTRLLDNFAASPGAVRGVRAFGVLSLGPDKTFPTVTGHVWDDPAAPMDFSRSLAALEALVSRGLVPFLPLTFFPRAVSPGPITPPPDWTRWQALVRGFVVAAVGRFGAAEVARWWFEVWNEPNMPPFWGGDFDQYLALYRATVAAVRESGARIRLGGPVLAYMPGEGPTLMERFLRFLAREPELQCNFISLHRKGVWVNEEREPDLQRLLDAAEATAQALLRLVPQRARGLAIVNNEADMRVGFDAPYEPRMTAQFPSWLAAVAITHDALSARYAAHGIRFLAASDNANQQLARGSFDGRRMLMTPIGGAQDLLKLPVYGFYEMLRLMRGTRRPIEAALPPNVHAVATGDEHGITCLLTRYAEGGTVTPKLALHHVPWPKVNVVTFCIDATHTNPRGGGTDPAAMRRNAELATQHARRPEVQVRHGTIRLAPVLGSYATLLIWITPYHDTAPGVPGGLKANREDRNVILRWAPTRDPAFYSYAVSRDGTPVAPVPLRAALWVDTDAPPGPLHYTVAAVSASGRTGPAASVTVGQV